ncbi:MAG: hypothetical protein F7C35_06345 [Desulfurococcales archaeon]|nr:hypothetical protein [Desulfurococcales archaeon]
MSAPTGKLELTACPILLAESPRFMVTLLAECGSSTPCGPPVWLAQAITRILEGESPYTWDGRERAILFSTLYGGFILFYKSSGQGVVPLSRLQIPTTFSISLDESRGEGVSDEWILELWAKITLHGSRALPQEVRAVHPPLKINPGRDGNCRPAPVGYSFHVELKTREE